MLSRSSEIPVVTSCDIKRSYDLLSSIFFPEMYVLKDIWEERVNFLTSDAKEEVCWLFDQVNSIWKNAE